MSTATTVPETRGQSGDDAGDQLRRTGTVRGLREAAVRFRAADGTSYARALGHSSVVTLIPAVIAVIGLVTAFDLSGLNGELSDAATSFAPGPAGRILTDALEQAEPSSGTTALVAGVIGMLVSGTVGMTHLERAANRIYGVEEERPAVPHFVVVAGLAATAGVMLMLGLAVVLAGGAMGEGGGTAGGSTTIWSVARWPFGVLLVAVSMTLIFKLVPNRRQPKFSWLLSGTVVAVVVWLGATVLLGLVYENAAVLGGSYGPLLGMLALLMWGYASSLAVLFGLSFAAQLEADRAGPAAHEGSAR